MSNIESWIEALGRLYNQYGYLIVFLGALGENTAFLGLVLPGGTLALLGAFYARQGTLNIAWVIAFAWIGTVLGYSTDYLLGRLVLARAAPAWAASRVGRRMRLAGRLRLARVFLVRHGGKAILLSHAVGHLRSFVALTAGMTRMRYPRFLAFELVAALLWTTAYCLLGYIVGAEWSRLQTFIERAGWGIAAALVVAYVAWRLVRRRGSQSRRRTWIRKGRVDHSAGV